MSAARQVAGLAALALVIACGAAPPVQRGAAPSPAEDEHPSIFAPGIISSSLPEFAITFMPDGKTLYFNRASADRSTLTIMTSAWSGGRWSEPGTAQFSGRYRDVDPFASPDGQRVYFSSDRPRSSSGVRSLSTWYVERSANGWSEPIDPGEPLNSDSTDVFVSVARDGTMMFSSTRNGRRRVYETRATGDGWERPRPVRFGSVEDAGNVSIAPSGRFVILAMDRPRTRSDLFISCRAGSAWTEPRALSDAVNTKYAEFAPAIDLAETVLYFTSERPGMIGVLPDSIRPPGDIYRIGAKGAGITCP